MCGVRLHKKRQGARAKFAHRLPHRGHAGRKEMQGTDVVEARQERRPAARETPFSRSTSRTPMVISSEVAKIAVQDRASASKRAPAVRPKATVYSPA